MITVGMALVGCVSEQRPADANRPDGDGGARQKIIVDAPDDLHDIAGYLLRFRTLYGGLPVTLDELRDKGVMPAAGYDQLDGYAYHPRGLGVIDRGRVVMVVDRTYRIDDHLWCVIREPGGSSDAMTLNVTLVPTGDLYRAARRQGPTMGR